MTSHTRSGLVSFRLTAWYCGLFSLSLAVLFAFVYWTLDATLRRASGEILESNIKEFADTYKDAGLEEIQRDASLKRSDEFLIRLADSQNRTFFASLPYSDAAGPPVLKALEDRAQPPGVRIFTVGLDKMGLFEFAETKLKNGYILQIGRNEAKQRALLEHFVESCAAVTLPVLVLAIGGGALMANRALRPLRNLTETVENILKTGNLDARIGQDKTTGELQDLVVSFDRMLEKIQALMEGMRGVLDNVAHDLRTPITRLRGAAELALRNPADAERAHEALADCIEESERVVTMLNTLMDISEVETGSMKLNLQKVDVAELARQLTGFYEEVAEDRGLKISMAAEPSCETVADESRLRQAVANLLDNAVKYTPAGGTVDVGVKKAANQVVVTVRDTGIGIPEEDLPRVWERLYRGDKSRSQRGLGLGLSLVHAIAQAHLGECKVASTVGEGSEFTLRIPAVI